MLNEKLKPCPFCGAIPLLEWEQWSEISKDSGAYRIYANHKPSCFITHIDGMNSKGRITAFNKECLIEWWNRRAEQCD